MKKANRDPKYRRFIKNRAKRIEKRKLRRQKLRKEKNKSEVKISLKELALRRKRKHKYWDFVKINAPENFSFIKNQNEIVKFIRDLETCFEEKKRVYVVLRNIKYIDYGAIVVLLSIMVKFKSHKIDFNGDFPRDESCNQLIRRSGFFDNLYKTFKDEDRYKISAKETNGIHTHAWKDVDSVLGAEIISLASKTIWNEERRCQGVQRALIELMQNTNNHAAIGKSGEKHWWLSVNHMPDEKKVCFSFVDFGVGVFENLQNKTSQSKFHNWTHKLATNFKYGDNSELLKLILNGALHQTVTGKNYRGKGLPGIAEAMRRNQFSNLYVITNNVYCDVTNDRYELMQNSFSGTFVYWEVCENNESCK